MDINGAFAVILASPPDVSPQFLGAALVVSSLALFLFGCFMCCCTAVSSTAFASSLSSGAYGRLFMHIKVFPGVDWYSRAWGTGPRQPLLLLDDDATEDASPDEEASGETTVDSVSTGEARKLKWNEGLHYRLLGEVFLEAMQVPTVLLIAWFASAINGFKRVPNLVLILYLLIAARMKLVEADICRTSPLGIFRNDPLAFFTNMPSTFDAAAHSIMVINMYVKEDDRVHRRGVAAWATSQTMAPFSSLLETFHFSGVAALFLVWISFLHLGLAFWQGYDRERCAKYRTNVLLTKLVGLGGITQKRVSQASGRFVRAQVVLAEYVQNLMQGLLESAGMLFIQTSFEMANGFNANTDWVGTGSMAIAALMLFKTAVTTTSTAMPLVFSDQENVGDHAASRSKCSGKAMPILMMLISVIPFWAVSVWMGARIYGLFSCPSSEWDLEVRCLPFCDSGSMHAQCVPKY